MTYNITIKTPRSEIECIDCISYEWRTDSIIDIIVSERKNVRASLNVVDYIEIVNLGN